jgi:peptide/nickel transport system substrate-binding protein
MEKFSVLIRNIKLPKKEKINAAISSFSKKEWSVFTFLLFVLIISTLLIVGTVNRSLMVSVPLRGGSMSIGIVGTPRFINPIIPSSLADQDMTALIYSGLMRKESDGSLSPDLAEKYEMSEDGLTYTFTLKDNIYFHNKRPITADDVMFTVAKAKDPVLKSIRKSDWDGVSVAKIDDKTIEFTLKQPLAYFLEKTTMGIMPESVWKDSPIELNTANIYPIGSGPYMIKSVGKESSGTVNSYELESFKKFTLGEPFIKSLSIRFYQNEDSLISALGKKEVDQISSITPLNADILKERNYKIESSVLPRVFGIFFNQNQNQLFTDKIVTRAIDKAIDKEKIIREVLLGYGVKTDKPIPENILFHEETNENKEKRSDTIKEVEENLSKNGWKKNEEGFLEKTIADKNKKKTIIPLQFSISTGNAPELVKTAELIKQDLEEIGMKVDIKTFEVGNLNQSVIRPRKYDALLFGQIINSESDLYAFWHSSQRKDPGLNVSLYTNAKVDKILEDSFTTLKRETRINKLVQFEEEIKKDMPAVFLYSPDFIYTVPEKLKGLSLKNIISPSDRFLNIHQWYTETENVWKIFAK